MLINIRDDLFYSYLENKSIQELEIFLNNKIDEYIKSLQKPKKTVYKPRFLDTYILYEKNDNVLCTLKNTYFEKYILFLFKNWNIFNFKKINYLCSIGFKQYKGYSIEMYKQTFYYSYSMKKYFINTDFCCKCIYIDENDIDLNYFKELFEKKVI